MGPQGWPVMELKGVSRDPATWSHALMFWRPPSYYSLLCRELDHAQESHPGHTTHDPMLTTSCPAPSFIPVPDFVEWSSTKVQSHNHKYFFEASGDWQSHTMASKMEPPTLKGKQNQIIYSFSVFIFGLFIRICWNWGFLLAFTHICTAFFGMAEIEDALFRRDESSIGQRLTEGQREVWVTCSFDLFVSFTIIPSIQIHTPGHHSIVSLFTASFFWRST